MACRRPDQEFQTISGTLGTLPIEKGRIKGEQVTFMSGGAAYTGRINGSSIKGSVNSGGAESDWTATRARR